MYDWHYKVKGEGTPTPILGNYDYKPVLVLHGTVQASNVAEARVKARRHCELICGVRNAIVMECAFKTRTVE